MSIALIRRLLAVPATTVLVAAMAAPGAAFATTITVTDGGDTPVAGGCTLRQAVIAANTGAAVGSCAAGTGIDTIKIAVTRVTLSQPGSGTADAATGDLDINHTLTIDGAAGGTTVDGAQLDRVFDIAATGNATLTGLTITGGLTPLDPVLQPDAENGEMGGGIRNAGALTVALVTITGNATASGTDLPPVSSSPGDDFPFGGTAGAGGAGGGIASSGTLTMTASTVDHNVTGNGGRGAVVTGASDVTVGHGGASANGGSAGHGGDGGGVFAAGPTTITASTITDNVTGNGGVGEAAHAGTGGSLTGTSQAGGPGGRAIGGSGGSGGAGGGFAVENPGFSVTARSSITQSFIARNRTGAGGLGAIGFAGGGGNASSSGTASGGVGGEGDGGTGGQGGAGGGIKADAGGSFAHILDVTSTTITGNSTGAGADGGPGYGAPAGRSQGTAGPNGGLGKGGNGGSAGSGAGVAAGATNYVALIGDTVVGNATSEVVGHGATGLGGFGGNGTTFGADGPSTPGQSGGRSGGGVRPSPNAANLIGTIVSGNVPDQCAPEAVPGPTITSIAYPGGGCVGAADVDPRLGSLDDHGGATPTFALPADSPAIDAFPAAAGCPATDQRGVGRPAGAACDVGAYERSAPAVTTGPVTATTAGAATVGMTVDRRAGASQAHVVWGATAAHGARTADVTVASGADVATLTITLDGLAPSTTYHYQAIATGADGTGAGVDRTLTTAAAAGAGSGGSGGSSGSGGGSGGSGGATAATPPVLSGLRLTPAAFRPATKSHKKGRGTIIGYTDSAAATTTFTVQRKSAGVRKGNSCVARTKHTSRGARRCTRWTVLTGTFSHHDARGANRVRWTGVLHGKALAAGSYRLQARPKAGAVAGRAFTVKH
ncbi:choice-of-anchor Q domain-containing protein [Baekduia sp.]|jgi:hypothetical protein|uniref:choice-of-anchor Q domain-containing protein n=1 Tax=Baekduia sp. TaxID=2600305 RepID=UPI002E02F5D9|nr:choice-of-anchor Q domain-containing protein [Baekduia sp.]